jgi:ankyrin repeat protein
MDINELLREQDSEKLISTLKKEKYDFKIDEKEIFLDSIHYNLPDAVKCFINEGVNIDRQDELGETGLMIASGHGYLELVKLFLSHNANIHLRDNDNTTAFSSAAIAGKTKVMHYLYKSGAPLMGLCKAADNNQLSSIKYFIKNGANLEERDKTDSTALMIALINQNKRSMKIADLLIDSGADLNAKRSDGMYVLHYAAEYATIEIFKKLCDNGMSLKNKANRGRTAIDFATEYNSPLVPLINEYLNRST